MMNFTFSETIVPFASVMSHNFATVKHFRLVIYFLWNGCSYKSWIVKYRYRERCVLTAYYAWLTNQTITNKSKNLIYTEKKLLNLNMFFWIVYIREKFLAFVTIIIYCYNCNNNHIYSPILATNTIYRYSRQFKMTIIIVIIKIIEIISLISIIHVM